MSVDLALPKLPFVLPLLVLGAAFGWAALRRRKSAVAAPTVLVCVACEHSVSGRAGRTACARCGGPLEDVRGFYDRHPERK